MRLDMRIEEWFHHHVGTTSQPHPPVVPWCFDLFTFSREFTCEKCWSNNKGHCLTLVPIVDNLLYLATIIEANSSIQHVSQSRWHQFRHLRRRIGRHPDSHTGDQHRLYFRCTLSGARKPSTFVRASRGISQIGIRRKPLGLHGTATTCYVLGSRYGWPHMASRYLPWIPRFGIQHLVFVARFIDYSCQCLVSHAVRFVVFSWSVFSGLYSRYS